MTALQAVLAVKAIQRIPEDVPSAITFFSRRDEWIYTAVYDNRACIECLQYEHETLTGDMLRSLFPFLEILDLETIAVNAHPNCRCRLERTLFFGDIGVEH